MSEGTGADDRDARIRRLIDALVDERHVLRRSGADGSLLDANRLAIMYWQDELRATGDFGRGRAPRQRAAAPARTGHRG